MRIRCGLCCAIAVAIVAIERYDYFEITIFNKKKRVEASTTHIHADWTQSAEKSEQTHYARTFACNSIANIQANQKKTHRHTQIIYPNI